MNKNAHRSVKQHDGCRSRRQLLLCGCRPQPPVPPRQTKECLAFPATACVEAMKPEERRERSWSKERSDAKKKKIFNSSLRGITARFTAWRAQVLFLQDKSGGLVVS